MNGEYKLSGNKNGNSLYTKVGDPQRFVSWSTQANAWIIDQNGPAPYRLTFVNDCILKRYGTNFPVVGGVWEPYQQLDDCPTMIPPPFTISIYNDPVKSLILCKASKYKPIISWHVGMSFVVSPCLGTNGSSLLSGKIDTISILGTVCRMYQRMLTQPNNGVQKMVHHDILKPILDLVFHSTSTTVRLAASKTASMLLVFVSPRYDLKLNIIFKYK